MAREFSAGTVYVQVVPSLKGWTQAIRNQLRDELAKAGYDPKAGIPVNVDPKINDKALAREIKRITKAHKGELILTPKLDEKGLKNEAEKAKGFFDRTFASAAASTVSALPEFDEENLDDTRAGLQAIRKEAEELSKLRVGVDIDERDLLEAIDHLKDRAKALERDAVTIQAKADASQAFSALDGLSRKMHATSTEAQQEIRDLQAEIDRIHARRVDLEIDSGQAMAELAVVEARLEEIRGETMSVSIRAEADQALRTIRHVHTEMEALDGETATVHVKTDEDKGFNFHIPGRFRTKALVTAVVASSGALGGLGAAFLAVAAGAVTAGAAVATFAVGMTDIAAAMKAQTDASRQAGQTAAQEAAQRLSAAHQVLDAQDAITAATEGVAEAQRRASISVRQAVQAQARAEEDLAAAQVDALRAQEDLTDARREAERSLQDLNLRVTSDALAQRQAILDVQDAQENLNKVLADPSATERQRAEAQLGFDQATQRLTEVSLAYQRSQADAQAANAAGVEGSDQVVAAQGRIVDSQRRVRDAELASKDAAEQVTEARIASAQAITDAQRQLVGAQRNLEDARARDAVQAVAQGEAATKLAEAWARLTPASKQLIGYLRAQSGEWDQVRKAAQGFAPGLQEGLTILAPHMDALRRNVGDLSGAFGDFLAVIARGLVDAEPTFSMLANASRSLLPRLGESVNRAGQAFGELAVELIPLAPLVFDVADGLSELVRSWTPFIRSASGPLLKSLSTFVDNLKVLGPLLDALAQPAADLTDALGTGLAQGLQNLVDGGLEDFLQAVVDIVATLAPLIASAGQLAGVVARTVTPALEGLNIILKPVVDLLDLFVDVLDNLPTPLSNMVIALAGFKLAAGPLEKLVGGIGTKLSVLGDSASGAAYKMGASEKNVGRTSRVFGRLADGASAVGRALPLIGIAFTGIAAVMSAKQDQMDEAAKQVDDLAKALVRGGDAAKHARDELDKLRRGADINRYDTNAYIGVPEQHKQAAIDKQLADSRARADQIEREAREYEASVGRVQVAQERADEALRNYNQSLATNGDTSVITADKQAIYQQRLRELRGEQDKAAEAAKTHTQRILEQQDALLAMGDSRTALARTKSALDKAAAMVTTGLAEEHADNLQRIRDAEEDLAEARKLEGPERARAVARAERALADAREQAADEGDHQAQAQMDLAEAQSRYVSQAGATAEATAKAAGKTGEALEKARMRGVNEALIELIGRFGAGLNPALLDMAAGMDTAEAQMLGLQTQIGLTGDVIMQIPGGPNQPPNEIKFKTSGLEEAKKEITDYAAWLDAKVKEPIKGWAYNSNVVGYFGEMPANAGLKGWGYNSAYVGYFGEPLKKATGGSVPGTGSGDSVPIMATPGEFVFSRPAVQNLGLSTVSSLHSQAVQGFASGGLVRPLHMAEGGEVPVRTGEVELADLAGLIDTFGDITTAADPATAAIVEDLIPALRRLAETSDLSSRAVITDWQYLTAAINSAVTQIVSTYLPSLRYGLAQVDAAMGNTARSFAVQWQAVARSAADPVRWMLANPFTALINAWNVINTTFAVGKPLAPLPIAFAAGGPVTGGVAGKDSVPALLMPGEFVVPTAMADQIGMDNLEAARRSVLGGGSAEGVVGFEAGGAVTKAMAFARAQVGKPYIWGGVGPTGWDCSGFMSGIANVALGEYPYKRRFTTAAFTPGHGAGGFVPGSGSTFVIGVSGAHMSGNLAGTNIESTTKNGISGPRVGGDASSPTDPQFTKGTFYLPEIGGTFIPAPTGSTFDIATLLDSTFADTRAQIAAMGSLFGANTMAAGATAELSAMLAAITGWAQATLAAPPSASVAIGAVPDAVRAVAARWGWGAGPQWDALSNLVSHESGWNPTAQNPTSTAYGLFQFLQSTWAGTGIGKTSDPALQTEAGMRYISGRYRDPIGAWSFWSRNHWYDDGGVLPPGISLAYNGTGKPEPVLSPRQWETLAAGSGAAGGQFTGELYLDSGQFLGAVRGEIAAADELTARSISRRTRL